MRVFSLRKFAPYLFLFLCGWINPAHADDWGCQVLLCLSNPNGPTAVSECVPPINKLWSELAKGHGFPTCTFAPGPNGESAASQASKNYGGNEWASLANCPPQYVVTPTGENSQPYCSMSGAVYVVVDGKAWTRIWWNGAITRTEYSGGVGQKSAATAEYDAEYAAWYAAWKRAQEEAARNQN